MLRQRTPPPNNGVIGLQPTTDQWLRLARTALWPKDDLPAFQNAFWNAPSAYDAGQLGRPRVLGHGPRPPPRRPQAA